MPVLYVHIPKTAGSSIIKSIPNLKVLGHRPIFYESSDKIHLHRMNVLHRVPRLNEYISFAVKRNPYTRFLSAYFYLSNIEDPNNTLDILARDVIRSYDGINDFIKDLPYHMERIIHFVPQHVFITHNGRIIIDHVLPFEDFPHNLNQVFHDIPPIMHVNKSTRHDIQLTDESIQMLQDCYRDDFEILGYDRFSHCFTK